MILSCPRCGRFLSSGRRPLASRIKNQDVLRLSVAGRQVIDDANGFATIRGHGVCSQFIHEFGAIENTASADEHLRSAATFEIPDE